jgi:hypothetical protein
MMNRAVSLVLPLLFLVPAAAAAQVVESVGERALGMGGAFVAVANDSTASWWNPAAQAAGPLFDLSIGRPVSDTGDDLPAQRDRTSGFALATPALGASFYHLRATRAGVVGPTADDGGGRQDDGTGVPLQSLSVYQFGVTVVQTLLPGVHLGTTLKYLRGTARSDTAAAGGDASDLLDRGDALTGPGQGGSHFDLDVGLIAVGGPLRAGAVIRNVREPEFADVSQPGASMRLPRQVRAGVAVDGGQTGALPLTVSLDVDLRAYPTARGDRRVVAVGAEQWLAGHRVGLRGGARFNTEGLEERAATGGASLALRSGLFVEGHVVGGDEQGWGVGARVSF